ncbi:MAG: hypothetical protein JWM80_2569 [Cyanobacteria bacterium RYN_339]|nr:hypothetical protein [Cyanobacteria bacterium RYN_339]
MVKQVLVVALAAICLSGCWGLTDQSAGGGGGGLSAAQDDPDEEATDEQGIWDAGQRPKPKRHPKHR